MPSLVSTLMSVLGTPFVVSSAAFAFVVIHASEGPACAGETSSARPRASAPPSASAVRCFDELFDMCPPSSARRAHIFWCVEQRACPDARRRPSIGRRRAKPLPTEAAASWRRLPGRHFVQTPWVAGRAGTGGSRPGSLPPAGRTCNAARNSLVLLPDGYPGDDRRHTGWHSSVRAGGHEWRATGSSNQTVSSTPGSFPRSPRRTRAILDS